MGSFFSFGYDSGNVVCQAVGYTQGILLFDSLHHYNKAFCKCKFRKRQRYYKIGHQGAYMYPLLEVNCSTKRGLSQGLLLPLRW